ncbi:hypothetical protein NRS6120_04020 [Bacillus subtilis]|nr:hypothetical protein NRS6120_01478 [Bacillus subtilis]CAI6236961.1 hypothetical protein NRS6120_04020 [Bacillus subtilis]
MNIRALLFQVGKFLYFEKIHIDERHIEAIYRKSSFFLEFILQPKLYLKLSREVINGR